jgi:hypothetical protein
VDQVERGRQAAESCLNVLLNVETADEIKTFAAKMAGTRAPISPVTSRRQPSQAEIPPASTPPVQTPPSAAPLAPPPRIQDDAASQRSERSERATAVQTPPGKLRTLLDILWDRSLTFFLSKAPEAQPRHTPLGGLRRLGTVMNRRKSVVGPSAGTYDRKAEKKHRSPFAPFKRSESSRDMPIPESPPGTPSDRPGTSLAEEEPVRTPDVSHDRTLTDTVTPVPVAQPGPTATNGTSQEARTGVVSNGANQVDSEGFTERPSTIDEITRAQREASYVIP